MKFMRVFSTPTQFYAASSKSLRSNQPTPARFIPWPSIFQGNLSCDFQGKHLEVSLVQTIRLRLWL
jgi:hypothetical protein